VPNEDLSNHVPWLESKRRSRARRKEARQARSRDRRRKPGAIVAAATLTFAAGGALAQSGGTGSTAVKSAGSSVAALQSALGITADGVYGPNTRRAVRNYQRNQGLVVDGIAGPVTLAHLGLAGQASGGSTSSRQTSSSGATASAPNATLAKIAACESSGNPAAVSASGQYRGKYQFSRQTWAEYGGSGDPAAAPEAEQDRRAAQLYAQAGPSQWPVCGR
jgi:peptidoglycan hydrolase-like protein with peptidoglycan-binding domain